MVAAEAARKINEDAGEPVPASSHSVQSVQSVVSSSEFKLSAFSSLVTKLSLQIRGAL